MNKPTFPLAIIIFLSILILLFLGVVGGVVYFVHNPSDASFLGRLASRYVNKKVDIIGHSIYLRTIQDPDKDKDGLTDLAEKEIYKTDPNKFSSNGTGVSDGEYIASVYKKAFDSGDEAILDQYRKNLETYKYKNSSPGWEDFASLYSFSLDSAFSYRSRQTYNLYVGMSDDEIGIVKQALDFRLDKGDYQKSFDLLNGELLKNPNSAILKYHLGLTYHGMEQYDKALSIYKSIISDDSVKSPLLYSDIASANYGLGNDDEYVKYIEISMKEFPEDLEQYLTLSSYYQDKNELDKAVEVLNKGLKIEPRYASFYNALAIVSSRKNDTKTEFDLYKKALSYDVLYASSYMNLSIIYDQKYNDNKSSLTQAQISLEFDPSARHMSRVIDVYNELGQTAKSKALEAALLKMPGIDGRSYNDLGLMYMDREDYKQAETYLRKAILLEPRLFNAYNNLGIVLDYTGRIKEAITYYKKAIEINPNYANAYNNLGIDYTNTGQYKDAQIVLEKAIQLDPNTYKQYQNLGALYRLLGNKEKMIFYYRKAVELGSTDPAILDYLKSIDK